MIEVTVTLSQEGVIGVLGAQGHAGFALRGSDIVCSAFTVLLRTFARTVEACPDVVWSVPDPLGDPFQLTVTRVGSVACESYRGWCQFLLCGFEDLAREYPRSIRIQYGSHSGRLFHGS